MATVWRPASAWPYGLSALLHALVALALFLIPGQPAHLKTRQAPLKVTLIPAPPRHAPQTKPAPPTPARPAPIPAHPAPRQAPARPQRAPIAARPQNRPTPVPTPTPKVSPQAEDKVAILRSIPELAKMSDEELKAIPLPPGVKSWKDFVKLANEIGMFKGAFPPPTTVQQPGTTPEEAKPVWQWEQAEQETRGVTALATGILSIVWPKNALEVTVTFASSDADAKPTVYTLTVGPGSDREAVATAAYERLPIVLASPSPTPAP